MTQLPLNHKSLLNIIHWTLWPRTHMVKSLSTHSLTSYQSLWAGLIYPGYMFINWVDPNFEWRCLGWNLSSARSSWCDLEHNYLTFLSQSHVQHIEYFNNKLRYSDHHIVEFHHLCLHSRRYSNYLLFKHHEFFGQKLSSTATWYPADFWQNWTHLKFHSFIHFLTLSCIQNEDENNKNWKPVRINK